MKELRDFLNPTPKTILMPMLGFFLLACALFCTFVIDLDAPRAALHVVGTGITYITSIAALISYFNSCIRAIRSACRLRRMEKNGELAGIIQSYRNASRHHNGTIRISPDHLFVEHGEMEVPIQEITGLQAELYYVNRLFLLIHFTTQSEKKCFLYSEEMQNLNIQDLAELLSTLISRNPNISLHIHHSFMHYPGSAAVQQLLSLLEALNDRRQEELQSRSQRNEAAASAQ